MKKILEGWLGGHYSDLALHDTKEGSGRGMFGEKLDDELLEFQEKKIRITVEVIEE